MTALVNYAAQSIIEAAYELGRDDVLLDPTDDAIVLAAAEVAYGNWPINGVPAALTDAIVAAWANGCTAAEIAREYGNIA